MARVPLIAPSFLSADFLRLGQQIEIMNQSEADWFHMDIMDGMFVPNISFGFPVLKQIKTVARKPLDVHLMIMDPDRYLERFAATGADILTVHYEACTHLHRTVSTIRQLGMKAGVSINPHIAVELLQDILPFVDLVLVMSVNPGFGGQKFIEHSLTKIRRLAHMRQVMGLDFLIEVDGGVNLDNARQLVEAGTDVLVAGSAIFGTPDPGATVSQMKRLATVE
jgi:ribulose-phosphate 3-epimerase